MQRGAASGIRIQRADGPAESEGRGQTESRRRYPCAGASTPLTAAAALTRRAESPHVLPERGDSAAQVQGADARGLEQGAKLSRG